MLKVFDRFTAKRRYFVVKEKNLVEVMKMFDEAMFISYISKFHTNDMTVGNCRLVGEHDAWFVHVNLTNKQWLVLLKECKEKEYKLVIKDQADKMYFEKSKES